MGCTNTKYVTPNSSSIKSLDMLDRQEDEKSSEKKKKMGSPSKHSMEKNDKYLQTKSASNLSKEESKTISTMSNTTNSIKSRNSHDDRSHISISTIQKSKSFETNDIQMGMNNKTSLEDIEIERNLGNKNANKRRNPKRENERENEREQDLNGFQLIVGYVKNIFAN